jgi:histidinol-phosphate/aromatic aminotransferase/cobyric acid decarboxylase-like protein
MLDALDSPDADPRDEFEHLQELHGSYWRYELTDHVHPVYNPGFPPPRLIELLRQELVQITRSYPVAQSELCHLVGAWTGAPADCISVGNGASELIKLLCNYFTRQLTVHVPAFNEYEDAGPPDRVHRFWLSPPNFDLDARAFGDAVEQSGSDLAVVITPNIPTGRSVARADILALADRLAASGCRLLVDESFIEYSRLGGQASVEPFLEAHPNIVVIKSLGKVCGTPGLRLGYLMSGDREFVASVRARLPIWNVNGLAEAFLRQVCRHRAAFEESCGLVRAISRRFYEDLSSIPGIEALETDANFVLCKTVSPGSTAPDIAHDLHSHYRILVKECSLNTMPDSSLYLRIGSRSEVDNRRLVKALARVVTGRS